MILFLDFRPYIFLKYRFSPLKQATSYDMSYLLRNLTEAISIIMRIIVDESSCISQTFSDIFQIFSDIFRHFDPFSDILGRSEIVGPISTSKYRYLRGSTKKPEKYQFTGFLNIDFGYASGFVARIKAGGVIQTVNVNTILCF